MAGRLVGVGLIVATMACTARPYCTPSGDVCASRPIGSLPPEAVLPSPERLEALTRSAGPLADSELPFRVSVFPPFAFEGRAARISCFIPLSMGAGLVRLEIVDVMASDKPIDHGEYTVLIQNLPCGTLIVACTAWTRAGRRTATTTLRVKGRCNGDEGRT